MIFWSNLYSTHFLLPWQWPWHYYVAHFTGGIKNNNNETRTRRKSLCGTTARISVQTFADFSLSRCSPKKLRSVIHPSNAFPNVAFIRGKRSDVGWCRPNSRHRKLCGCESCIALWNTKEIKLLGAEPIYRGAAITKKAGSIIRTLAAGLRGAYLNKLNPRENDPGEAFRSFVGLSCARRAEQIKLNYFYLIPSCKWTARARNGVAAEVLPGYCCCCASQGKQQPLAFPFRC